jgi:hypothetical protein
LDDEDSDWTLEVERVLLDRYPWSLFDLDRTDIESLFPFFFYVADHARGGQEKQTPTTRAYCDQADWI